MNRRFRVRSGSFSSSSSRMVDVVRGRRKIQPPPRESKYSCFSFDLSNLLYLHNCRHDVRRHIREAKCVDIRHKTTCRVTNDTCPLLSSLDESNRTQWNPKLKRSKFEREFGGRNHNKRMKRVSDESLFANLGSFTNQHSKDMFNVSVGNNRSRFKTLGTEIHSTCSTTPTKTRTLSSCVRRWSFHRQMINTPAFETDAERSRKALPGSTA